MKFKQISTIHIKGEIEGIERVSGKTEVIVDEEGSMVTYSLSEDLINFTTALQDKNLKKCVSILENVDETEASQSHAMWQELKAISLKNWNIPIAVRCAAALGNISEAKYLRRILKKHDKSNQRLSDCWEVRASIHKLNREFVEAERLYLSHNRVDDAILMYENLMMFTDALRIADTSKHSDYETKKDSYFRWLLKNNQEEKAAQVKEFHGDYIGAISIYLEAGFPGKAAQIIAEKDIVHPRHVLESVATTLHDAGLHRESGEIHERMGQFQNALSHYIEGYAFREALNLASNEIPSKVIEIKELWGDHLVSSGRDALAIDHFVDAHALLKATEAAINAQIWDRASELASRLDDDTSSSSLQNLAMKFVTAKKFENAQMLLLKAKMNSEVVSMYINNAMLDKAAQVAENILSEKERNDLYKEEAEKMIEKNNLVAAERLYLLAGHSEIAINMWKNLGNYEEALRLIKCYRRDLMEGMNKFIANKKESEGKLSEAEPFYTAAKDWLGAVNMYRKKNMWSDAIRVAKLSEVSVLNRVAYAYSIHLGERAQEILLDLDILDNAIYFAVDSEEFEAAINLANGVRSKQVMANIHSKFAFSLEQNGKYEEAEEEYIVAGNISDAIEMYLHIKSWSDAERMAISFNQNVSEIYIAHAEDAAQEEDYETAKRLFIKGSDPERALVMYRNERMWKDAFRMAEEHLPHLRENLQLLFQESIDQTQVLESSSKTYFIRDAQALEESGQYNEAIDEYLRPQIQSVSNPMDLEDLWDNAIRIAATKCPNRLNNVSKEIASRLKDMGRVLKAAEVLSQSNLVDSAVEILIETKHWEQAKIYAQGYSHLTKLYIDAHRKWLKDNRDSEQLLHMGETKTAFHIMMNDGNWDGIWRTLQTSPDLDPDAFVEFSVIRIKELLQDRTLTNMCSILEMLSEQMAPLPDYHFHFDLYLVIVQQILSLDKDTEESCEYYVVLKKLKTILSSTLQKYKSNTSKNLEITSSFVCLIMTVHYAYMMYLCATNGLITIACKCSVSLLRYAVLETEDGMIHTIIPADKVFYNAGLLCRKVGHEQLSFMLLDRYVDIIEAMEENDSSELTEGDFISTDIPFDSNISIVNYVTDEDTREEARDWVLGACIDSNIERTLPPPPDTIEGSLYDGLYDSNRDQCIVTGYPIPEGKLQQIGKYKSNKDDWDTVYKKLNIFPWEDETLCADKSVKIN